MSHFVSFAATLASTIALTLLSVAGVYISGKSYGDTPE
jgi:glucokinase